MKASAHLKDRVEGEGNEKKDGSKTGVLESTVVDVLVVSMTVSIMMHLFRLAFLGLQQEQSVTKLRILSSMFKLVQGYKSCKYLITHSLNNRPCPPTTVVMPEI